VTNHKSRCTSMNNMASQLIGLEVPRYFYLLLTSFIYKDSNG